MLVSAAAVVEPSLDAASAFTRVATLPQHVSLPRALGGGPATPPERLILFVPRLDRQQPDVDFLSVDEKPYARLDIKNRKFPKLLFGLIDEADAPFLTPSGLLSERKGVVGLRRSNDPQSLETAAKIERENPRHMYLEVQLTGVPVPLSGGAPSMPPAAVQWQLPKQHVAAAASAAAPSPQPPQAAVAATPTPDAAASPPSSAAATAASKESLPATESAAASAPAASASAAGAVPVASPVATKPSGASSTRVMWSWSVLHSVGVPVRLRASISSFKEAVMDDRLRWRGFEMRVIAHYMGASYSWNGMLMLTPSNSRGDWGIPLDLPAPVLEMRASSEVPNVNVILTSVGGARMLGSGNGSMSQPLPSMSSSSSSSLSPSWSGSSSSLKRPAAYDASPSSSSVLKMRRSPSLVSSHSPPMPTSGSFQGAPGMSGSSPSMGQRGLLPTRGNYSSAPQSSSPPNQQHPQLYLELEVLPLPTSPVTVQVSIHANGFFNTTPFSMEPYVVEVLHMDGVPLLRIPLQAVSGCRIVVKLPPLTVHSILLQVFDTAGQALFPSHEVINIASVAHLHQQQSAQQQQQQHLPLHHSQHSQQYHSQPYLQQQQHLMQQQQQRQSSFPPMESAQRYQVVQRAGTQSYPGGQHPSGHFHREQPQPQPPQQQPYKAAPARHDEQHHQAAASLASLHGAVAGGRHDEGGMPYSMGAGKNPLSLKYLINS